jgi:hypothetical protein
MTIAVSVESHHEWCHITADRRARVRSLSATSPTEAKAMHAALLRLKDLSFEIVLLL